MTPEREVIYLKVRSFIIDKFHQGIGSELEDDMDLVKSGIVDSINVLIMVEFIEDEFDLVLEVDDIMEMTSVTNITDVIQSKLSL